MNVYVFVLVLLGWCGFAFSQECIESVLENIDFTGDNVTWVSSPDVEHCQRMCTEHPSCLFFSFMHYSCSLKSTALGKPRRQLPLVGSTSGYSLKPCRLPPDACLSKVYHDMEFHGTDYRTLFTGDFEECQRICNHDSTCHFFTFITESFSIQTIRYKCVLKYSWAEPRTPVVENASDLVSGFSYNLLQTHTHLETACKTKILQNINIPGHDIETLSAVSAEHCLSLCSAHPRCTYFTFSSEHLHCYLKNNGYKMETDAYQGAISGIPARFCQPDDGWVRQVHEGVHFRGSDIRSVVLKDPKSCQKACSDDPNCQFYTYFYSVFHDPVQRCRCYLKRCISSPAPSKVTQLLHVVSGFSLHSCLF